MTKVTIPPPAPTRVPPKMPAQPVAVAQNQGSIYYPVFGGGPVPHIVVPPGGFAGFAQQSPATQAMFSKAAGRLGGRRSAAKRRRRKAAAAKSGPRRRKSRRTSGRRRGARLKKGSAAAKRYMAKIRRMRKRR